MKYIQIGMCLCMGLACFMQPIRAQKQSQVRVEAVVRTPQGEPIPGAVINSNEIKAYTVADAAGTFSLNISAGGKFIVKAVGYKDQVVDAFRTVERRDLQGGVSYIDLPEFMKKDYTTYSLDGLQSYIGGYTGLSGDRVLWY